MLGYQHPFLNPLISTVVETLTLSQEIFILFCQQVITLKYNAYSKYGKQTLIERSKTNSISVMQFVFMRSVKSGISEYSSSLVVFLPTTAKEILFNSTVETQTLYKLIKVIFHFLIYTEIVISFIYNLNNAVYFYDEIFRNLQIFISVVIYLQVPNGRNLPPHTTILVNTHW